MLRFFVRVAISNCVFGSVFGVDIYTVYRDLDLCTSVTLSLFVLSCSAMCRQSGPDDKDLQ